MNYSEQFANGYAHFALTFLLSAVIGFLFFCIKTYKADQQESQQKLQEKNTETILRLAKKIGHLTVEYNEQFKTYYVFNTETGAFVTQNQNPLELLEYVRDSFITYEMEAKDESTARTMVAKVKELQQNRKINTQ